MEHPAPSAQEVLVVASHDPIIARMICEILDLESADQDEPAARYHVTMVDGWAGLDHLYEVPAPVQHALRRSPHPLVVILAGPVLANSRAFFAAIEHERKQQQAQTNESQRTLCRHTYILVTWHIPTRRFMQLLARLRVLILIGPFRADVLLATVARAAARITPPLSS